MRGKYLGDSYDLVKRFWSTSLGAIAPLYAHPKFVPPQPTQLRREYTAVTSIPILDTDKLPEEEYSLLFDPDTGIPLPDELVDKATPSHAPLPWIIRESEQLRPAFMICFDQSYHRRHHLGREGQREAKRDFLRKQGIASFYYISHAPFLFIAMNSTTLDKVRNHLITVGIPVVTIATPAIVRLQTI